MKWRTSISTHKNGEFYVRGIKLNELISRRSFSEAVYLILKGKLPSKKEAAMIDAILVGAIEHGVEAPSTFVARSVASTGNQFNAALAAGVLAIGEWHGGAIEKAARIFQSSTSAKEIVKNVILHHERLAGYGHKIYKDKDPRTVVLFKKAKELRLVGKYIKKAEAIERELKKQSGKMLPLNIDGAIAAIISDLGFDWRLGKAFFILGRLPGLIAHVEEEIINEKPYRRIDDEDVEYIGQRIK